MDNTVKTGEEKPDFVKVNHGATDVWEKYVVPLIKENNKLRSRIKELESENEELRKKGQWISVKERLPLTDEYVLITDGIEVWVGNYERSGYRGRSQWGQAFIGCSMVDDTEITHWQPLPSKP